MFSEKGRWEPHSGFEPRVGVESFEYFPSMTRMNLNIDRGTGVRNRNTPVVRDLGSTVVDLGGKPLDANLFRFTG